jgi:GTP-binding protein Era
MLRHVSVRRAGRQVAEKRRRWEDNLTKFIQERKETRSDATQRRFDSIYVKRDFTPVASAFPLADADRWAGLPPLQEKKIAAQPAQAHVCKVALLGPPNAGKSTFMNALVTAHVSATSPKAGTTSDWVRASTTVHDTQLNFLDTPGLFTPANKAQRRTAMPQSFAAWDSLYSADVVLATISCGLGFVEKAHKGILREVATRAAARQLPLMLALTKFDTVKTAEQRKLYFALRTDIDSLDIPFAECFEVSATQFKGIIDVKDHLARYATPADWKFYKNEATDLNGAERASEVLTEVFFQTLPNVLPHNMNHKVIGWTQRDGFIDVQVEVFFDRPTFMRVFYGKIDVISSAAVAKLGAILKKKVRFSFQAFITPGGRRR